MATEKQQFVISQPVNLFDLISGDVQDKRYLSLPVERLVRAIRSVDSKLAKAIEQSGRYTLLANVVTLQDAIGLERPMGSTAEPRHSQHYHGRPIGMFAAPPKLAVFADNNTSGVMLLPTQSGLHHVGQIGHTTYVNSIINMMLDDATSGIGFGH